MIQETAIIGGAIGAAMLAILTALFLFQVVNGRLDWKRELRDRNQAVAIVFASAIVATAVMVQGGLQGVVLAVLSGRPATDAGLQLLLGFVLSVVVVNFGARLFDWVTPRLPVFEEISEDNRAVAIALGSFMVGTAWILSTSLNVLAG